MLRQSLQAVHERGITGNLRESVRVLASIMQVRMLFFSRESASTEP
jgi:hypothetical protein